MVVMVDKLQGPSVGHVLGVESVKDTIQGAVACDLNVAMKVQTSVKKPSPFPVISSCTPPPSQHLEAPQHDLLGHVIDAHKLASTA